MISNITKISKRKEFILSNNYYSDESIEHCLCAHGANRYLARPVFPRNDSNNNQNSASDDKKCRNSNEKKFHVMLEIKKRLSNTRNCKKELK